MPARNPRNGLQVPVAAGGSGMGWPTAGARDDGAPSAPPRQLQPPQPFFCQVPSPLGQRPGNPDGPRNPTQRSMLDRERPVWSSTLLITVCIVGKCISDARFQVCALLPRLPSPRALGPGSSSSSPSRAAGPAWAAPRAVRDAPLELRAVCFSGQVRLLFEALELRAFRFFSGQGRPASRDLKRRACATRRSIPCLRLCHRNRSGFQFTLSSQDN